MVAGFDVQSVAMIQHNAGSYGEHSKSLKPEQFEALPLPKTADGRYMQMGGNTDGYSIFKNSKSPDAAWKFLSFLCSAPSQSYWNKNIGQLPTHSDVLKEPWMNERQHTQMIVKMLNDPKVVFYTAPLYLPEYKSILDQLVTPGIQAVMIGKKTPEELLNEWAKAVETAKQKYDAYLASKKK